MIRQIGFLPFVYLIIGSIILAFGWITKETMLDIAFDDWYYVYSNKFIYQVVGGIILFFGIVAFVFSFIQKPLYKWLGLIHFIVTITAILIIWLLFEELNTTPRRYTDYSVYDEFKMNGPAAVRHNLMEWIRFIFDVLLFTQLLFLVNVFLTVYKNRRKASELNETSLLDN